MANLLGKEYALSAFPQTILVTPVPNLNIARYAKNRVMSREMRHVVSMKGRREEDPFSNHYQCSFTHDNLDYHSVQQAWGYKKMHGQWRPRSSQGHT